MKSGKYTIGVLAKKTVEEKGKFCGTGRLSKSFEENFYGRSIRVI